MWSHRRISIVMATALILLMTLACQPPAGGPGGTDNGSQGTSLNALDAGFAPVENENNGESAEAADSGGSAAGDSDFTGGDTVEDPFAAIGPAFQGFGFQGHSAACDPFDEANGTCL